jgi:hypothetical protein
VGQLADLIVPDKDYFKVPEDEISFLTSDLTVVGGRVVYGAGTSSSMTTTRCPRHARLVARAPLWRVCAWGEPGRRQELAQPCALPQMAAACGCGTSCGMHGHQHANSWASDVPTSDPKSFFGRWGAPAGFDQMCCAGAGRCRLRFSAWPAGPGGR